MPNGFLKTAPSDCEDRVARFSASARPRDIILQIAQVLAVVVLPPLIQGIVLQFQERVQRGRVPEIFQPCGDLWKLFHKQFGSGTTSSTG